MSRAGTIGTPEALALRRWQARIFGVAWLTYASFYLGRVNLSVALPALRAHFGWDKAQLGLIGSAFFWVYALGQLVNGRLGDRLSPRLFVGAGLLASVGLNLAFGLSGQLTLMALLWAANGYAQSTGWGPILRTLSHWFDRAQRARLSAWFSPSFVAGHVTSWLLSGWLVSHAGWRAAFWVPGALMGVSALAWLTTIRDHPQAAGLSVGLSAQDTRRGRAGLRQTIAHPRLRWVAVACVFLGMAKDGITLWGPTFLVESAGLDLAGAAVSAVLLPLCGMAGAFFSGWLSGRFFESREAPVAALMLAALAGSVLGLRLLAPFQALAPILVMLGLTGAASYGANAILLTALPLGLGEEGIVSSAAGFLDFASYLGGGLSGVLTGWLADGWGWPMVFGYWVAAALVGGAALLLPSRERAWSRSA